MSFRYLPSKNRPKAVYLSNRNIFCCVFGLTNYEFSVVSLHNQNRHRLCRKIVAQTIRLYACRGKKSSCIVKYIIDLAA